MGIESTNDILLKYLNRKHDFKMVKENHIYRKFFLLLQYKTIK